MSMRWLLFTLILLVAASARADDRDEVASEDGSQVPGPSAIAKATSALESGDAALALSLLAPPPVRGPATCLYGRALEMLGARKAADAARVLLYLERCQGATPSAGTQSRIAELNEELRGSKLGQVSLSLRPASAIARLDTAYQGDTLLADDELWLAFGDYRLEVEAPGHEGGAYALGVTSQDRMLVPIVLPEDKSRGPQEIDLGEEAGAELGHVASAADPRPKNFKTLLAKRYQGPEAKSGTRATSDEHSSKLWPALTAAAGVSAIGLGVGLQVSDYRRGAFVSYGTGAALGGLAVYLLVKAKAPHAAGTRIEVDEELISLSYSGGF